MSTKHSRIKGAADAALFLEKNFGRLSLGRTIRSLRVCDEISQTDFAETLGVSRQYLCDLEAGRKSVSVARAAELAKVLGQPTELFIELAVRDELARSDLWFDVTITEVRRKRA